MTALYYYTLSILISSFLIFSFIKWKRNKKLLNKLDYSIEGKNIALSITKCKALHRELSKAIHPDRLDESQKQFADKLMQKVNAARYDYQQLNIIKAEVETFLNKKI